MNQRIDSGELTALVLMDGNVLSPRDAPFYLRACPIQISRNSRTVDIIIALNHSREAVRFAKKLGRPSLLVALEPRTVEPRHTLQFASKHYSATILFHQPSQYTHQLPYLTSTLPGTRHGRAERTSVSATIQISDRENDVVMFAANKMSLSRNENYTLRRSVVRALSDCCWGTTLYGRGWSGRRQLVPVLKDATVVLQRALDGGCIGDLQIPRLREWRALPQNLLGGYKEDALSGYRGSKLAIIIENDIHSTSEKVFGALEGGCVTVYVGPADPPFPSKCVIYAPRNRDAIIDLIERTLSLPERELEIMRSKALEEYVNWLTSSSARAWEENLSKDITDFGLRLVGNSTLG